MTATVDCSRHAIRRSARRFSLSSGFILSAAISGKKATALSYSPSTAVDSSKVRTLLLATDTTMVVDAIVNPRECT
jgi:hypothetical protein